MKLTITPTIQDSKVTEFSLRFNKPLALLGFRKLLETINTTLHDDQSIQYSIHKHNFISYPFYSHGEMTSVIKKCSCGKTNRHHT